MASTLAAIQANHTSSIPGKIIIRGTSKLSLKDRFTRLSNEMQQQQSLVQASDMAVSAANKRLAHELGNNPDVVAALRMNRKSVLQRLGVKARLGGTNGGFQKGRGFQQRNGFTPFRRGYRSAVGVQFSYFNNGYRFPRNFGPKRMDNNRMRSYSGYGYGRGGGFRQRFRGGGNWRYGRGGNRRGGGGHNAQNERMSREELDRQLDEYMSKTKVHLDDDLDAYMGETTI